MLMRFSAICMVALTAVSYQAIADTTWDGSFELEQRYFWDDAVDPTLSSGQSSARLQLEVFSEWNNGDDTLTIEPFYRLDAQDDERSHGDLRQFIWSRLGDNWELSAGLGRVFWGVTESQHLVDVVNQTDGVENIDGEDKLGQPMLRYQYFGNYGTLDTFVLPYFRTRTFAGADSRLNGGFLVNNDAESFESDDQQSHLDYALRYSHTLGAWDIGLSWFDGTAREPDLLRLLDPRTFTTTPYYPQINQFGADIQITTDAWLFKLEVIQRSFDDSLYQDFSAATLGAEYTFVGIFGSIYDLGVLSEYSWDERDSNASTPFQNDLFVGGRLAFNDINNSVLLVGATTDFDDSSSKTLFIEASTRVASALTANIEVRYFASDNPRDILFGFKDNSFIQVGIEYFFD